MGLKIKAELIKGYSAEDFEATGIVVDIGETYGKNDPLVFKVKLDLAEALDLMRQIGEAYNKYQLSAASRFGDTMKVALAGMRASLTSE